MLNLRINGRSHEFARSVSILDACRSVGIDIPVLCHDERLKPCGACRICLVKVKGTPHETVSCMSPIADSMEIETHTSTLEDSRRMNLRMLARKYPASSFRDFPEKPFHRLARRYGLKENDFDGATNGNRVDDSHPYIRVDMSRCIDCYSCVRICDEVQGQFVWQVVDRGQQTRIMPDSFGKFGDSTCVSCGACADVCPSGALEDKSVLKQTEPINWTKTVCSYCGTGCEMNVGVSNGEIVQIKPAIEAPVSHGHLCVKGRYAFEFATSKDRITEPMIRKDGNWTEVSWEEALGFAADELKRIQQQYGKEAAAVLGSARATNEENYLAQKFARVVLETNNADCCARVCHTPSAAAMKMMLGTGAATNSFNDIEKARTIMICGANPTENHPIIGERIKQAAYRNGTKLIVVDPRKIELTKYAAIHLQLRPGTNVPLFNALAYAIVEEGLCDTGFVKERVDDFEEFKAFVHDYAPEKVEAICDVRAEDIRLAARLYATNRPSMSVHGLGMTEHIQGTESVMCLINLALITGNIGKPGTGVNPLRGQNNVQGAAHMGCDPGILTGSVSLEEGREHFEKIWQAEVPTGKGLNVLQMMDAAAADKLKALWVIGYDVLLSNANAAATERAFSQMEMVIVQDMFMNETAKKFGTVFLPASSSFERDGTFMNGERRVQLLRQVIKPKGKSRSDWEIIREMAKAMGKGDYFNFNCSEEIWDEIRAVWPASGGITYDRIDKAGLQWPCPDETHAGTRILHTDSFAKTKRAELRRIKYRPTSEIVSAEFPFLLVTGRNLYHFNAGTMTMRTDNAKIRPTDTLDVSQFDADELAISDGEIVRLKSAYGEASLPVRISHTVKRGELFASFHDPLIFLNRLTGPHRDRYVQAPEYKVTAVKIEKLAEEPIV